MDEQRLPAADLLRMYSDKGWVSCVRTLTNLDSVSKGLHSIMSASLQPIQHPSAWRGIELLTRAEWNQELTTAEVDELMAIDQETSFCGPVDRDPPLPDLPLLRAKAMYVQDRLEHGAGVVRLRGLPADLDEHIAKHAFWGLCRHVGTPVSQSAAGERLFDVRDAGFADGDRRARGPNTKKKLAFHTDRCDVIGFLCFRQAKEGGENEVVSSIAVFNQMLAERPEFVTILMQPFLYQRHNVDTANEQPLVEQPIFSRHEGHFAANYLRVLIDRAYALPDTPKLSGVQRDALDYLEEIASRPEMHVKFRQVPGEILLLNNFVTLHRRAEFVDYEKPEQKRHLFRVWISMPNSRPLAPAFAGNYGNTAAGALRGGMRGKQ